MEIFPLTIAGRRHRFTVSTAKPRFVKNSGVARHTTTRRRFSGILTRAGSVLRNGPLHQGLVVGKHVVIVVGGGGRAGVFAAEAVKVDQILVGGEGGGHRVEAVGLAVAQWLILGEKRLLLLLLVVGELFAIVEALQLLLLICFVVVVRAGAAAVVGGGEEVGRATVGISSKEGHCVATAVAEILIASSKRLVGAGKCIGRGIQAHLISTVGNTIQVVPLELLLLLLRLLLLREGGRQAALAHGRRRTTAR